jgi:hypothetical protein
LPIADERFRFGVVHLSAVPALDSSFIIPAFRIRLMKLVSLSFGSWLLGLMAILLTFYVVEGVNLSAADVKGATVTSLIVAALLFSLAYAPSLFWLRRRLGGCRPVALFPLASALVLNLPVFLIGILAIGRTLAATEALAFIGAFVLMGTAFGWDSFGIIRTERLTYEHGNSRNV